ncbi:IclR family transcriptional regulator [Oceanibaculum pacificum]|nr:IclR family transcriptional regulator C-terminal domain-containing protein [Oceanibaculum pacificum]
MRARKAVEDSMAEQGAQRQDPLFVNSLGKGLSVLQAFGSDWDALGLREIAQRTGLNTSAAQRFTHTLTQLGYLRKDERTRRYRLGPRMLNFAYSYLRANPLYDVAIPIVISVRDEWQETVNVSVLDDTDAVVAIRMPSQRRINSNTAIGRRMPAYCVSTGRAVLAWLSPEERKAVLDRTNFVRLTPRTNIDRASLEACLDQVRIDGFAMVEEEADLGEMAVAAPIFDGERKPIAALGITTSTAYWSMEDAREKLAPIVMQAATAISRSLQGWHAF